VEDGTLEVTVEMGGFAMLLLLIGLEEEGESDAEDGAVRRTG
jgi:hypothetical protein